MRTEQSLRYTINTHLYPTNEFQLLLNCVSLQSAGGWAGKGTVKFCNCYLFIVVMCSHISPLLYSPLAEE